MGLLLNQTARLVVACTPKWPYPILFGPLRGYSFILGAAAGVAGGVSVHLGRVEIEQTRCVKRILKPGQVFFDLGANVGYYSLLASKIVGNDGSVVSFEPVPRNVSFLYRHVQLNRIKNVMILPLACSDSLGMECFDEGKNCAAGGLTSGLECNRSSEETRHQIMVATVSIDAVIEQIGLVPDLVKIDVEGAELLALRGAQRLLSKGNVRILLSVHSDQLRTECCSYLSEMHYTLQPFDDKHFDYATEFLAEPKTCSVHTDSLGVP